MVIIAFCDFALWNFDSENFGPVFPKFSFLGQNEAFSATEQNAIITILCSLEDLVQFSSISSAKAASASTAN